MGYDLAVYELAKSFGADRGLTDAEIARLSQHVQDALDEEIDWILFRRKEKHIAS